MAFEKWTREQTIVALNLYCKIPFNRVTSTHPDIIKIGKIIGRSTNSVKMKIGNFVSFDPELKRRGIVGLANASKMDRIIWNEFTDNWDTLAYESEKLIAAFSHQSIEQSTVINLENLPVGTERESIIRARVNQSFFRATILASYNLRCCVTGLSIPELLIASHIVPWAEDVKNRLNPHNGLCLNSIHDKAFDKGYITITTDYDSKKDAAINDFFLKHDNQPIQLSDKFLPDREFLEYHYQNIFKK
jgi:putative restriction endonuclease